MTFNGSNTTLKRSLGLLALAGSTALLSGCLDRPVGATKPETNNVFVKLNPSGGIDKIDLLFMIDNSLSMGDKQDVLAAAVPQLLTRLTNPDCVSEPDPTTGAITRQTVAGNPASTACPAGLQREFAPIRDIHIGAVTSSLGDYGGDVCPESADGLEDSAKSFGMADQNDHGWLLGALPRVQAKGLNLGTAPFLDWTPADANAYTATSGEFGLAVKTEQFRNFVVAGGELGCGFEMILESWYRFLIDPDPPSEVVRRGSSQSVAIRGNAGTDPETGIAYGDWGGEILKQRAAFLRPDSLVAVVVVADENDCSLKDAGSYSWWPSSTAKRNADGTIQKDASGSTVANFMFRPSNACATAGANDRCCYSCMLGGVDSSIPEDCLSADPTCRYANAEVLTSDVDSTNLRCMHQKQRFGYDFLFPVERYSNALTLKKICPQHDDLACVGDEVGVDNPLYDNLLEGGLPTGPDRDDPSVVFFAGIVGVPWQDLATTIDPAVPLQYKLASQLDWDLFAPLDEYATPPLDPLMIESIDPRSGSNPVTGFPLVNPDGAAVMANPINGHEWYPLNRGDIQFACVFSLETQLKEGTTSASKECLEDATTTPATPVRCAGLADEALRQCKRQFVGCACSNGAAGADGPGARKSPLCQSGTDTYSNTQIAAKAYPGVRELQALRAFHLANTKAPDNAIVASICPKDLTWANREGAGYGYNPAVQALVDRLKAKLGGTCLPRPLTVRDDGTVPCSIVELIDKANGEWCACSAKGREPIKDTDPKLAKSILGAAERQGICVGAAAAKKDPTIKGIRCADVCLCGLKELLAGDGAAGDQCLTAENIEKSAAAPGFCYVAPNQVPESNTDLIAKEQVIVGTCPSNQKQLIRIVGNPDVAGVDQSAPAPGIVIIACSGAPFTGD